MSINVLPATASAAAILVAIGIASLFSMGPFAVHMLIHIALMNLAAPVIAVVLLQAWRAGFDRASWLWSATVIQLVLLWAWHAPSAHQATGHSTVISVAMHSTLFAASLAFWAVLISMTARNRWQAVFSLLITGKLACLLGAILIFAPRPLYKTGHPGGVPLILDDQQLAGLIMISACPLSYVLAGVIIAAQAVNVLGRQTSAFSRQ